MHRVKSTAIKKDPEGNSSESSHRKRRKKYGKIDKLEHIPNPLGYQPHGFAPAGAGVRVDRFGQFWDGPEPVQSAARGIVPPVDSVPCRYAYPAAPSPYFPYTYGPIALAVCQEPNYYQATSAPAPQTHVGPAFRIPSHVSRSFSTKCPENGRKSSRPSKWKTAKNSSLNRSSTHDCQPNSSQNEYLSLPPGEQDRCSVDDAQRRFSDPGLGNPNSDSECSRSRRPGGSRCTPSHRSTTASESGSSFVEEWPPHDLALLEQVKLLRADNKRLSRQLRATRNELQQLKLESSKWRTQYQPGMIADLVREVRDAARLREETLVAQLRLLVTNGNSERVPLSTSSLSRLDNTKSVGDRDVAERLTRLEGQVEGLRLNQSADSYKEDNQSAQSVDESKDEKLLASELREVFKAQKMADANSKYRLERGTTAAAPACRKNGTPKVLSPAQDTETEESLASMGSSTLSSLSAPAACVTMSGPVTDL